LTGKEPLEQRDREYFDLLMGGMRELTAEEKMVVRHFAGSFMSSHAYFQLIECMVGRGDIYTVMRMAEGAPYDLLFTHAGIPVNNDGSLADYNGQKGLAAFKAIENDIRVGMSAWRWFIETGDRELIELDAPVIDRLGELAWGAESPLYLREMQTAARTVLEEGSGMYDEPEGPFFKQFLKSTDQRFVDHVTTQIASSFGLNPRRMVIVHGHKPNKSGHIAVEALGHALNIDAGTAASYGGHGAFLLIGTGGLQEFSLDSHQFSEVTPRLQ
jgi:fructose-1,6-bisphosphatase